MTSEKIGNKIWASVINFTRLLFLFVSGIVSILASAYLSNDRILIIEENSPSGDVVMAILDPLQYTSLSLGSAAIAYLVATFFFSETWPRKVALLLFVVALIPPIIGFLVRF